MPNTYKALEWRSPSSCASRVEYLIEALLKCCRFRWVISCGGEGKRQKAVEMNVNGCGDAYALDKKKKKKKSNAHMLIPENLPN